MGIEHRVVVTGLGVVTALGMDEHEFGRRLFAGEGGIRRVQAFDLEGFRTVSGAEVDRDGLAAAMAARKWAPIDPAVAMGLVASFQALEQAGLVTAGETPVPQDVATLFGSGWGPAQSVIDAWASYAAKGIKGMRPTSVPRCMTNAISAQVSLKLRLTGANYTISSACASSAVAAGLGYRMVRDGHAERVLCGGADSAFDPGVFAAWNNLGVMSRNQDPTRACRPFDRDRDGFVMGEGGGAVVLESLESATARGATIRAEVCGYGESSDAEHLTSPSQDGQMRAVRAALASAGMAPGDVGLINAHGTATQANDVCESRALREVFGAEADGIPVVSSKSYFGHVIGAAGVVELIASLLCLEAEQCHGSLNLDHPDPACELALVGARPVGLSRPVAVTNSFGFGGNNAVLVLRRYP